MPSSTPLLALLTLTASATLAFAQAPAAQPAATPPAEPAATQPAPRPLTPEQEKIIKSVHAAPIDKPFPKIDSKVYGKDGKLNPNFGQLQITFKNMHEIFLKRKEKPIGILFLGDSITAGWGNKDVKPIWEKHYGKLDPANFGIGGDRTEHVLWRIENGELDGISPKVVVLMIGTNNSGNTAENITAGVTAIAKKINEKLPNSKLLLLGIFPRGASAKTKDGKPSPIREKYALINANLAKLDDGKKTFFLDITDKFLEPDGSISKEIMGDALHPGAKGYQIWADAMQPKLDELLK